MYGLYCAVSKLIFILDAASLSVSLADLLCLSFAEHLPIMQVECVHAVQSSEKNEFIKWACWCTALISWNIL